MTSVSCLFWPSAHATPTLVPLQCRQAIGDGAVREVIEWEEVAEMVLNWPRLNDLKRALGHPVHKYIKGGKVVKVS